MRASLALEMPGKDGVPPKEHLLQVWRQSGKWDKRLDSVRIPVDGQHLWVWYWQLRRDGMVSMAEIDAYCRLLRVRMTPWEIATIRAMDVATGEELARRIKPPAQQGIPHV